MNTFYKNNVGILSCWNNVQNIYKRNDNGCYKILEVLREKNNPTVQTQWILWKVRMLLSNPLLISSKEYVGVYLS